MEAVNIAPCGMNCGICLAFLRKERKCPRCRGEDSGKTASCLRCIVINCTKLPQTKSGFCYECAVYPCARIKQLDKRYRTKYSMSMMENLAFLEEKGMKQFLKKEAAKWKCHGCGQTISCHRPACLNCGQTWTPTKYR